MSQISREEQPSIQVIQTQARMLASSYSLYNAELGPGRDKFVESMEGPKMLELFKWVDTHPEARTLLLDYHERELQHEHMNVIKAYDDGPPLTNEDPAEKAHLVLRGLDAMESSFLGAVFGEMARSRGYDLAGQVRAAEMGANFGELFLAGAETRIAEAENKEHVKMAEPKTGEKLYAKGKPEHLDSKSFEPLGQGLPGYKTFNPNEKEESEDSEKSENRESEDKGSERIEKPSREKSEQIPTSPNREPNFSSPDGREIYVPPNREPNFSSPDARQVPTPTEGKQLSTPADGGKNFTPVDFSPAEVKQSLTPELQQSVQPPEALQSIQLPEAVQSVQSLELQQSTQPPEALQNVQTLELQLGNQPVEAFQHVQTLEMQLGIQPPEALQSVQPPELQQSIQPSEGNGYGAGGSDTSRYDGGSSDAGGYDGGYSDGGGYDGGDSDADGYDGGGSDDGASDVDEEAHPVKG